MPANCLLIRLAAVTCVLALAELPLLGKPPETVVDAAQVDTISRLAASMDNESYVVREAAMRDLRALLFENGKVSEEVLSGLFQLSLDPKVSFEAQRRLAELLTGIEWPGSLKSPVASEADMAELMQHLSDNRFTTRETATRRLDWMLRNRANIVPALLALKLRLADAELSVAIRQGLTRHFDTVRRAWLLAPANDCPLPAVSDKRISELIEVASTPSERKNEVADQQFAIRELQDLLCRDEYREPVTERLTKAMKSTSDPVAAARLHDLVDLTRPSMVAEIWSSGRFVNLGGGFMIAAEDTARMRLATMQYLHIGVPQVPENAMRATYFDRCDDKTAHCVSGNTLHPGDYPVGTAILHPEGDLTLFHLVNLPTPRRRLIYEYSASNSEAVRFRDLSQKTCEAYLSKARPLTAADVPILMLLDRAVVAQFAGRFFETFDDAPFGPLERPGVVGPTSRHGAICCALAFSGSKDAAAPIIKAIEKKRFLPLTDGRHYDLPLIALLSIARRDPWAGADDWLGQQLRNEIPLATHPDPVPDLAATAAAILLERHGESIDEFGLESLNDGFCQSIPLPTYHFRNDDAKQAVLRWWLDRHKIARTVAK